MKNITKSGLFLRNIKPVSEPSAQSATLCDTNNALVCQLNSLYTLIGEDSKLSIVDKAIIEIQILSGCRIGSALKISHNDISQLCQIRIPAEKGGLSVVITPYVTKSFWLDVKYSKITISQFRNRFYMYRLYKRLGIFTIVEGNINKSVTHFFRHIVLDNTQSLNLTERERANYAGQKSIESQKYYLSKFRQKR